MKSSAPVLPPLRATKVLDQLRERVRYLHYSLRTEKAYLYWVRMFIRYHKRKCLSGKILNRLSLV